MSLLRLARTPALVLPCEATVMDAIRLMVQESAGAVAVVEGRRLSGIFTERDVMKKVVLEGLDPAMTPLRNVMTPNVTSVTDALDVNAAIAMMSEKRIRHIPIVNEDKEVQGMLSLRYLLHDRLEDMLNELRGLEAYMNADGPGG